ncbi:copper amine oxidase N-terminal domain-containing protein [Paenibacillus sp. MSJ-34]|uniref:copper amine oxidase N-terminal domain-containing protein n=1 Tax=Paenibacillus sp. MSJ-34 TaxID=2841529 RepID=UPI001C10F31F|nr:copper amine oxidase N-terminal domain-containing protein [Paenibacillus sp. MSJ-34]MBU5445289.1 copper amine oxidase N-terminal domain-containing protein [Paenibacillus sp. MSJ-34]
MSRTGGSKYSKKAYRRTLGQFAVIAVSLTILICAVTYIFDPLQFYRKATFYTPVFSTEERYQNPGLAKNYDYDTIIIGTSMTQNFVPSYVDRVLGGKTMKLSMEGSTANEHYLIAKRAIATGKVKRVLWGLDYFSLKAPNKQDQESFPYYLYDDNPWNDIHYLFNISTAETAATSVAKQLLSKEAANDLDMLNNWDRYAKYGQDQVLENWRNARNTEFSFQTNEEPLDFIKNTFETNIISLIEQHPEIEFIVYYPPYTILRHQLWSQINEQRYENQLEMKKYMFERFHAFPNVKLYDFQADSDITYNLNAYKDLSHHSQAINETIIDSIARDDEKYRVTPQNIDRFISLLEHQVHTVVVDDQNEIYNLTVQIDGETKSFSLIQAKADGEAIVPLKEAVALLGASFEWDAAAKKAVIKRGERRAEVIVGRSNAQVDGADVVMAHSPAIVNGRTMIPLQFVAKALGGTAERVGTSAVDFQIEIAMPS